MLLHALQTDEEIGEEEVGDSLGCFRNVIQLFAIPHNYEKRCK